jgi:hypothetical protein
VAQQESLGKEQQLAALDHSPNLQVELAMIQTKALQLAKDTLPISNKNPMLGEHQPPPAASEVRAYSNMIGLMNNPSLIFNKIQNGTITRKDVDSMNAVLPAIMKQITEQSAKSAQNSIQNGQALKYQERLRMGIITGTPWDPSDSPKNIKYCQNIWGAIAAAPPTGGRPRGRSSGSKISERRESASERIGNI